MLSRNVNRRPLRSKAQRQIEHLEDRCLLSAISISDVTVTEGDGGTVNAVFTITLDASDPGTITVLAASAPNTATDLSDYTALPPTLVTFLTGEISQTVTVSSQW